MYETIINIDPENHEARNKRRNALDALGKDKEDIEFHDKGIEFKSVPAKPEIPSREPVLGQKSGHGKSPSKPGRKRGVFVKRLSLILSVIVIAFIAYKIFAPGSGSQEDFKIPVEPEKKTTLESKENKTDQSKPTATQSRKQDIDKKKKIIENKPGNKEEEIPADVKAVKRMGYTIYKNDKGYECIGTGKLLVTT